MAPLATSSCLALACFLVFGSIPVCGGRRARLGGGALNREDRDDVSFNGTARQALKKKLSMKLPKWYEEVLQSCEDLPEVINETPTGKEMDEEGDVFFDTSSQSKVDTTGRNHMLFDSHRLGDDEMDFTMDESCPLIGRSEAVDLIKQLAGVVENGVLDKDDFDSQTVGCGITTCKADEIRQSLRVASFIQSEDSCGEDSTQEDFETCLAAAPLHLNMIAAPLALPLEHHAASCHCDHGEPIKREVLLQEAAAHGIARTPSMMRDAATEHCQRQGVGLGAFFNSKCAAENYGYCCIPMDLETRERKESSMQKAILKIAGTLEHAIDSSQMLQDELEHVMKMPNVNEKEKVMLYKLYIIYYHHAQLLLDSHLYCSMHPDDMATCLDPVNLELRMTRYSRVLKSTSAEIMGVASCMKSRIRPLAEELVAERPLARKVLGLTYNIAWRAVHYVGSGQLLRRVRRLFLKLTRNIYRYRFELTMAGVFVIGAEPLMLALTATGITTGSASASSTVFTIFMRQVLVRIGCVVLKSPIMMSMLVRWTMANLILTDVFIDNVITPLWTMVEAGSGLALFKLSAEVVGTSVDVIRKMLQKVRDLIKSKKVKKGKKQANVRMAFLEAAREFHATPAADFLYGFLAVWVGSLWEPLASVACAVAEGAQLVSDGLGSAVEAGALAGESFWMTMAASTSNHLKRLIGDDSFSTVVAMQAEDSIAKASMDQIAPKVLAVLHKTVMKLDVLATGSVTAALDAAYNGLSLLTQSSAVTYAMSSLFVWFFQFFFKPKQISDISLSEAMNSARSDFNLHSCAGKKHGTDCLFLEHPVKALEHEEVSKGSCCLAVCQAPKEECATESQQQLQVEGVAPSFRAFQHYSRQNKLLHGFATILRSSYGDQCSAV